MGYADPPGCSEILSQLCASSLEVMGFEVRCPASTGQVERGEELWGPLPSILHSGWGTRAVLGCQPWRPSHSSHGLYTASVSISYLRLSFISFQDLFLLTQKNPEGAELN